ncbi:MAG: hypothetical protein MUC97_12585 [Bernardetiaceae bacterium]|jgi:hypothetical protein|nr:hypothetical protein [Bernardetiaceae bacterium]
MAPHSPITGSDRVELETLLPVADLLKLYRPPLRRELVAFFDDTRQVRVLRCQDTGYSFYYPFDIVAPLDWPLRAEVHRHHHFGQSWAYRQTLQLVQPGQKVLEIGATQSSFLQALATQNQPAEGLPWPLAGVAPAPAYDWVCSFGRLSQVSQVKQFVQTCADLLKPGGHLAFSVPNTEGFVGHLHREAALLPPAQAGRWTEHSLRALAWAFAELEVAQMLVQPLQPEHYRQYYQTYLGTVAGAAMGNWVAKLTYPVARPFISVRHAHIFGPAVLVVYQKKA